uniref:Uncharacterized protein n=1 Tax=Oryza nivara TaxID=4536 RepID=A0A0E0FHI5_ORYNI
MARFNLTLSRDTARPQTDRIGGILGGKFALCLANLDGLLHRCAIGAAHNSLCRVLLLHEAWEWEGEAAAAAAAAEAEAEDRALRGIWAVGLLCRWQPQPQECSRKLTISCTPLH